MDKKERIGKNIKIKKYDDIFEDINIPSNDSKIEDGATTFLPTSKLRDFKDHPFKVDGKGIDELMNSIREHGILSPLIVRGDCKGSSDEYEIISGHRRKFCAAELGLEIVPVIIKDIGDDEAILAMVDSNIQREDILPSEKAFAYKMKLEAIKRQGKRTDLTSPRAAEVPENGDSLTSRQVVGKLESADIIGKKSNESGRQIQRYIRLTELPAALINAIDSKKMSFNAGVELSFLNDNEKNMVEAAATEIKRFPTLEQASKLKEMSENKEEFSLNSVINILMERKNKTVEVNFDRPEIRKFFPKKYTATQIEDAIIEMLRKKRKK